MRCYFFQMVKKKGGGLVNQATSKPFFYFHRPAHSATDQGTLLSWAAFTRDLWAPALWNAGLNSWDFCLQTPQDECRSDFGAPPPAATVCLAPWPGSFSMVGAAPPPSGMPLSSRQPACSCCPAPALCAANRSKRHLTGFSRAHLSVTCSLLEDFSAPVFPDTRPSYCPLALLSASSNSSSWWLFFLPTSHMVFLRFFSSWASSFLLQTCLDCSSPVVSPLPCVSQTLGTVYPGSAPPWTSGPRQVRLGAAQAPGPLHVRSELLFSSKQFVCIFFQKPEDFH